jgi:uncharacterized protein (DUF2267 family)
MNTSFAHFAEKGNEFMEILAERMGSPADVDRALRVLKAVLHTLRDHIPVSVSLHFISSLPLAIKAVYVDGWKPGKKKRPLRHKEDLLAEIRRQEPPLLAAYDLKGDVYTASMIAAVWETLQLYISEGEQEDFLSVLPSNIRTFVKEITSDRFHLL